LFVIDRVNMSTEYNIVINIASWQGMREIGRFFIGADGDFANDIFAKLKGDSTSKDVALIRIDLEKKEDDNTPARLKSICCSLNQYIENCRIMTLDIFMFFTLHDGH